MTGLKSGFLGTWYIIALSALALALAFAGQRGKVN